MGTTSGLYIGSSNNYTDTITALNGETIKKVEMTLGFVFGAWESANISSTSGAVEGTYDTDQTVTLNNADASEITLSAATDGFVQNKTCKIYYEGGNVSPSKETTPNTTFTATGSDTGTLSDVKDGMKYSLDGTNWTDITSNEITSTEAEDLTVAYKIVSDKNDKKVSVPATVKKDGKTYTVTSIDPDAFKDSKATTVTIGQNVKKISPKAFNNSRVTTIVVKTKKLNKSSVKKALKGCKSKKVVVKVSVGSNEENRKYKKKYKKIFKKKNVGKKVSVKKGKVSKKK